MYNQLQPPKKKTTVDLHTFLHNSALLVNSNACYLQARGFDYFFILSKVFHKSNLIETFIPPTPPPPVPETKPSCTFSLTPSRTTSKAPLPHLTHPLTH